MPELLCVLCVLEWIKYEKVSSLTNSDIKCTLISLLYEHKNISEGPSALKNFKLNIDIFHPAMFSKTKVIILYKKKTSWE